MNADQVAALLLTVQGLDGRPLDGVVYDAWGPILAEYDYNDAVLSVRAFAKVNRTRITPADIVAGIRELRRERAEERTRALNRGVTGKHLVVKPPWFDDAEDASHRAKLACLELGFSHGHPITVRSCLAAAHEVQDRWEAENGRWTDAPLDTFAAMAEPDNADDIVGHVLGGVFGGTP